MTLAHLNKKMIFFITFLNHPYFLIKGEKVANGDDSN